MGVIGVRELRQRASEVLRLVEKGEPTIVTRHGRPVATITSFSEADLEDYVLSHHPEARSRVRGSIQGMDRGRGLSLTELRARWSLRRR